MNETDEEYAERARRAEQALDTWRAIQKEALNAGALGVSRYPHGEAKRHTMTLSCRDDTAIDLLRVLRDLAEQGGLEIELAIVARVPVVGPQRKPPHRITATIRAGDIPPAVGQAVYMRDDGMVSTRPAWNGFIVVDGREFSVGRSEFSVLRNRDGLRAPIEGTLDWPADGAFNDAAVRASSGGNYPREFAISTNRGMTRVHVTQIGTQRIYADVLDPTVFG